MKISNPAVAICIFTLSVTLAFGKDAEKSKKHPVVNTDKWAEVSLPFRPFNITARDGDLWVCGLDETIAVSKDGGASWQVQHQKQNGEILLNIAFVNEKIGHAAGTGGLFLSTDDGGQTWSSHVSGFTIEKFSFSGLLDGIAEINGRLNLTSDGGDHWQEVSAMQSDSAVKPFSQIETVAALNPTHFAVALHQPEGENIFLATADAGKTWTPTHVINTFAGKLVIHGGEYWAFGIEYLGREHDPSGGYSAPVALHSADAHNWQHGATASTEFNGCTDQGCFLPYGVVEVLFGDTEKVWSLPQDLPMTSRWAMAGTSICMIRNGLKCGTAIDSDVPQPMPDEAGPMMFQVDQNQPFIEGCVDCHFTEIPPDPSLAGRPLTIRSVIASLNINSDGSIKDVEVRGTSSKAMGDEIARQISHWLIAPAHNGSGTIPSRKQIELSLLCFSGLPGHPETAYCSVKPATQGKFQ